MAKLSKQEQEFLDYLFDGDEVRHPDEAKVMAGYAEDFPWIKIIRGCSEALIERYDDFLALHASKGVVGLLSVIENPQEPGSAVKLKAITELLNRAGVVNKEKKEVASVAPSHVFILPSKQPTEE